MGRTSERSAAAERVHDEPKDEGRLESLIVAVRSCDIRTSM